MDYRFLDRLDDLERRLARVEGKSSRGTRHADQAPSGIDALHQWVQNQAQESGGGVVAYAGTGPWDALTVAWQVGRSWDDILAATGRATASLLSALANPTRIRIVGAILRGSRTTADLIDVLDQPSSGQLFHHLKDLIAAGVIHQPVRGVYAVRPSHVVALLTIMCAAIDLVPAEVDHEQDERP